MRDEPLRQGGTEEARWYSMSPWFKKIKMITGKELKEMALSFPGTGEKPHFDRVAFHVIGKRMFATYLESAHSANIFLTPQEQRVFCDMDSDNIFQVPNKWGEKGATTFDLHHIQKAFVMEALLSAYNEVLNGKSRKSKRR